MSNKVNIGVFKGYDVILIDYEDFKILDTRWEDKIYVVRPYYTVIFHEREIGCCDINIRQFTTFDEDCFEALRNEKKPEKKVIELVKVEEKEKPKVALQDNGKIIDDYLRNFNNTMENFFKDRKDVLANVGKY